MKKQTKKSLFWDTFSHFDVWFLCLLSQPMFHLSQLHPFLPSVPLLITFQSSVTPQSSIVGFDTMSDDLCASSLGLDIESRVPIGIGSNVTILRESFQLFNFHS